MSELKRLKIRYIEGPSLLAPHAVVVAEFSIPFNTVLSPDTVKSYITELLPVRLREQITYPSENLTFESLAAMLACSLQDVCALSSFSTEVQRMEDGVSRILLSCFDPRISVLALQAGLQIADAVFSRVSTGEVNTKTITAMLQQAGNKIRMYQPDFIACALFRVASKRGIPVYPVSPGSRIWLYGQGSAGQQFFEAANQSDSLTGALLTRNKFLSNQLITRLGFPGVRHMIANSVQAGIQIVRQLGFPVVVKPPEMGKGQGVTSNITTEDELATAVSRALAISPKGALVERYVPGDDHRLAVVGGKLAWVVRRTPPSITGDGSHTIAELVEMENQNRSDADVAAGYTTRLTIDADMRAVLSKQGFTPEDRPANGAAIRLRSVANIATGGTITDCTVSIHPDNREMAESIARGFRMDTLGIDFMTADISKSWREHDCAVIEVNATPGFSSDNRAEAILLEKFPPGTDGRIPSIVLIGEQFVLLEWVVSTIRATNRRVGQTSATVTLLEQNPRCHPQATLPARVKALLLDTSCDAIVIAATVADIKQHGFPLDRCDLVLIAETASVSEPWRRLFGVCSAEVVDAVTEQNIEQKASTLIATMFGMDDRDNCK